MTNKKAIRGSFFHLLKDPWPLEDNEKDSAQYIQDGLLLIDDGIISKFGTYKDLQGDLGDRRQSVPFSFTRRHAWGSSRHLDLQGRSLDVLLPRPFPLLVLLLVLLVLLMIPATTLSFLKITVK